MIRSRLNFYLFMVPSFCQANGVRIGGPSMTIQAPVPRETAARVRRIRTTSVVRETSRW
jgi:hypothetical protein